MLPYHRGCVIFHHRGWVTLSQVRQIPTARQRNTSVGHQIHQEKKKTKNEAIEMEKILKAHICKPGVVVHHSRGMPGKPCNPDSAAALRRNIFFSLFPSDLSPKRDCSSERVNLAVDSVL